MEQNVIEEWLNKTWDNFITGFCKVEFVCYEGEPNWLGFLLLIIFFPLLFYLLQFLGLLSVLTTVSFFNYKPFGEERGTILQYLGISFYLTIILFILTELFF